MTETRRLTRCERCWESQDARQHQRGTPQFTHDHVPVPGFTREDLRLLAWCQTSFAANPAFAREADMLSSLAHRIEALLPAE